MGSRPIELAGTIRFWGKCLIVYKRIGILAIGVGIPSIVGIKDGPCVPNTVKYL
jgi:hypothetical protein